jgi:hypothetical protein
VGLDGCPFASAYVGRKRRATRISCYTALTNDHVWGFSKESRMSLDYATKLNRKSGRSPTIALCDIDQQLNRVRGRAIHHKPLSRKRTQIDIWSFT